MAASIAISVSNPQHVANTLAEIWEGYVVPLLLFPNTYIVHAVNSTYPSIELYPADAELVVESDPQSMELFYTMLTQRPLSMDQSIPVPISSAKIQGIAAREGWRSLIYQVDSTEGVELWVENQVLLALLPQ